MVTDAHVPPDPPPLAGDGLGGGVQYLSPETPPNAAGSHTAEGAPMNTATVNVKIADMEPVKQRLEQAAAVIERLRAGLVDIIAGQECEAFLGRPYCRDVGSGRSRDGVFADERWCDTCIAHDALAEPPIGASE